MKIASAVAASMRLAILLVCCSTHFLAPHPETTNPIVIHVGGGCGKGNHNQRRTMRVWPSGQGTGTVFRCLPVEVISVTKDVVAVRTIEFKIRAQDPRPRLVDWAFKDIGAGFDFCT